MTDRLAGGDPVFGIDFVRDTGRAGEEDVAVGRLVAGDLDETFEVLTARWDEAAYRASWGAELRRLLDGADRAVLLTAAVDPRGANWLRGYVLYRFADEVRIQERMFLLDDLECEFDLSAPSEAVTGYESVNEDGIPISEWTVPLADIRRFHTGS